MKKIATKSSAFIILLVCITVLFSGSLISDDLNKIAPVDFDKCVQEGNIEFRWEWLNTPTEPVQTLTIMPIDFSMDVTNITSIILNSVDIGLQPGFLYTWNISGGEVASSEFTFATIPIPQFGNESLEDGATCVVPGIFTFDWTLDPPNFDYNNSIQLSEDPTFSPDNLIEVQHLSTTVATAVIEEGKQYFWRLYDITDGLFCSDNVSETRTFFTTVVAPQPTAEEYFLVCENYLNNNGSFVKLEWYIPGGGDDGLTYIYNLIIKKLNVDNSEVVLDIELVDVFEYDFLVDEQMIGDLYVWQVVRYATNDVNCYSIYSPERAVLMPIEMPTLFYPASYTDCVSLESEFRISANTFDTRDFSKIEHIASIQGKWQVQIGTNTNMELNPILEFDFDKSTTDEFKNYVIDISLENPNTTHYWRVRQKEEISIPLDNETVVTNNFSFWSTAYSFTSSFAAPVIVSEDQWYTGESLNYVLEWTKEEDATGYEVEIYSQPNPQSNYLITRISNIVDTFTTYTANTTYKHYYWYVKSIGESCESGLSTDYGYFTTEITHPTLIYPEDEATINSEEVTFVWNKGLSLAYYDLEYTDDLTAFEDYNPQKIIANYYLGDTTLLAVLISGKTYYWRVRQGIYQGPVSQWTDIYSFEIRLQSNIPTLLYPVNGANCISILDSIAVVKDDAGTKTNYKIEVLYSGGSYVVDITQEYSGYFYGKDTLYWSPEGLFDFGTTYQWRAKAWRDDEEEGDWTNYHTFTTTEEFPESVTQVLPLDGTIFGAEMIVFEWEPVDCAIGYDLVIWLLYGNDEWEMFHQELVTDATTFAFYPQVHEGYWEFRWSVYAINEFNIGEEADVKEFMVIFGNINDPTFVSEINISANPVNSNSNLNIDLKLPTNITISIYDISGNLMHSFDYYGTEGSNIIPLFSNTTLDNFNSGSYSITVTTNEKLIASQRFVYIK